MTRRHSPHQMQPLAVRSSLPRSYCLIILTYSNELRCYELLLWEVVGGYPSYLHINHRRNPHTQVPPNPPEILSLPRPIVHGQIDSLGLKQAGWGASGVGGLAMGQGPLSLTVASCHTNYGTLLSPFSMARSPNKPSPPPPMHDPELVVCCTLCLHKGLLAALVVYHHLPLPSFSQTSQRQNEGTQETS